MVKLKERMEHRRKSKRFIPNPLTIKAEWDRGQPPLQTQIVPLGTTMDDLIAGQEKQRAQVYEDGRKFRM